MIGEKRKRQTFINTLLIEAGRLTAVRTQLGTFATTVTALQSAVADIQSSLNELPDNSEAINEIGSNVTELAEELAETQTAIASLTAQLVCYQFLWKNPRGHFDEHDRALAGKNLSAIHRNGRKTRQFCRRLHGRHESDGALRPICASILGYAQGMKTRGTPGH